jgi:hypothetical protein
MRSRKPRKPALPSRRRMRSPPAVATTAAAARTGDSRPLAEIPIGHEIVHHVVWGLIFAIGIEGLLKPSPRLSRRIKAGIQRFKWDIATWPQSGLEVLAGIPPSSRAWWRAVLAATPIELPTGTELRAATHMVSQVRLRIDYRAGLAKARAARRMHRGAPACTAWAAAFPAVPRADLAYCKTARDATLVALGHQYKKQYPRSKETLGRLVHSTPQRRLERLVADLEGSVLAAVRQALANAAFAARAARLRVR